jgi:serine/threonine protein phosphatase 1
MANYVTADLHGNYNLWEEIKDYLKRDDILYFLGDAIDRGPRGFEILKEMLDDPRIVFIRGNHEDMMLNSFIATGRAGTEYFKQWKKNGGGETLNNMHSLNLTTKEKIDYVDKIRELPTVITYINKNNTFFWMSHAGAMPTEKYQALFDYEKEYSDMWDRKHFLELWPQDWENIKIIHGHTPVQLMYTFDKRISTSLGAFPLIYENGHKINLDTGAIWTNQIGLYNLDTEAVEVIFKGETLC